MTFIEIRKELKKLAKKEVKKSHKKFIPSGDKIYGVRIPFLNLIAKKIKEPSFDLVEKLWGSGYFEEKILGCKILAKISDKNPLKTLKFIKKLSRKISDWAVCDTLGSQSIKKISKANQKEIYGLAEKLISSKNNFWQRRLGIVFLIELNKKGFDKEKIKKLSQKLEKDSEHYIKKAVIWLKAELKKIE
ncbi:MAG: DNA alkylation repair protein [bacterium]|nr:DNA alkylation repair protein [bacterium]